MVLPSNDATKSYWIEAAESPLRNHRSSEQLPAETDIAIIGSGYAGVSTAYWIHKYSEKAPRQPKATILEARDVCGGATGRNGGQLRPHAYSRYPVWRERFGPNGAMALIKHEMAHLAAFKELAQEEGITEEVCLQLGETFDAAMTEEAWARLSNALHEMRTDHGDDDEVVRVCRAIEDAAKAEEFTQMKGALGAIVHPAGSIWPYKFVHALLRKLLETGKVDLHANTPVTAVSERNADGWITVTTPRGTVRARTVVHTTNRWAPHLLPEFNKIILPQVGTIAAIKAPPKFIKHTGAQHWDSSVNNYHIQLPPPHNIIILGGARQLLVHNPETGIFNDNEDKQLQGVSEFYKTWPASDVKDWPGPKVAEFGKADNEGGVWTGLHDTTADNFPFVGPLPSHRGQFINAGFNGHGMPRILLSSAYIAPLALDAIGFVFRQPRLAASFPPLPQPFHVTPERVAKLQNTDVDSIYKAYKEQCQLSAKKPFCNTDRVKVAKTRPNL